MVSGLRQPLSGKRKRPSEATDACNIDNLTQRLRDCECPDHSGLLVTRDITEEFVRAGREIDDYVSALARGNRARVNFRVSYRKVMLQNAFVRESNGDSRVGRNREFIRYENHFCHLNGNRSRPATG